MSSDPASISDYSYFFGAASDSKDIALGSLAAKVGYAFDTGHLQAPDFDFDFTSTLYSKVTRFGQSGFHTHGYRPAAGRRQPVFALGTVST